MIIKTTSSSDCKEHDVTDEKVYQQRRELIKKMGFLGAGSLLSSSAGAGILDIFSDETTPTPLFSQKNLNYIAANGSAEELTPEGKITGHNNFYEFGVEKQQPAELSQSFKVDPWTLKISGEVENPLTLGYDDLYSSFDLEERIYRLRCVEAWSMVVPWIGFSLADLVKKAKPTSRAKYLVFETLYDPAQMPGQRSRRLGGGIDYPYVEGLRIDEAMNPLALMSVGLYGKTLPPQNGAPIRLVVPWKYGFKVLSPLWALSLSKDSRPRRGIYWLQMSMGFTPMLIQQWTILVGVKPVNGVSPLVESLLKTVFQQCPLMVTGNRWPTFIAV